MQDMQAGIVFLRQLDGSKRRFKTGFGITDDRMMFWFDNGAG